VRVTRLYVPDALAAHTEHTVREATANHITRVLRLRSGDALVVFDGRGGQYAARIAAVRKSTVVLRVAEHEAAERESPLHITLAQGISRGERMDFVMQKATELGVSRIVPVVSERSVVRLDAPQADNRLRHWRAVVIAACEQCGRNRVPELDPPLALERLLASEKLPERRLMLTADATLRVRDLEAKPEPVAVLIGPEGGLAPAEHSAALRAGFLALRVGPRVLRTETAALTALAALQLLGGDL